MVDGILAKSLQTFSVVLVVRERFEPVLSVLRFLSNLTAGEYIFGGSNFRL